MISEKGYFVFENGCILPHPYYCKKGNEGPSKLRGSKISANTFHEKKPPKSLRNQDGWPMNNEITHLCH